jgi:hypothetical protein
MRNRNQFAWTLWIAAISAISPGAWAQTPITFAAAPSFSAGTSPTGVTAGFFNNDSYPDLAVTNQHGVSILINDTKGGFLPRVDYPLPTGSNPVSIGTFTLSNGNECLAVVNQGTGTVTIFLGNGDGTFQLGATYPAGVNPRQIIIDALGCCNPVVDSYHLMILDSGAGPGTSGVSVLMGNGDGTFQAAKFFPAGTTSVDFGLVDFNNDNFLDLVVANAGSDDISILLGNGDGTFQSPINSSLNQPGVSVSPTSVAIGDFNSDGILDVVVSTPNVKGYAVLLGLGQGKFRPAAHYLLDDPNFVNNNDRFLGIGLDIDGDGMLDLVLSNYSADHVTVLFGAGDGTFARSKSYAAGPSPSLQVCAHFSFSCWVLPIDNHSFYVSNNVVDGLVTALTWNPDGTLQAAPLYRSSFTPESLAVGDLNNDGILDIVAASPSSGPGVGAGVTMLGNGDGFVTGKGGGTFKAPVTWTTTGATSVALGDFNGDGKLDLVSTQPTPGNGNVSVWLGKGDGTFQTPTPFSAGTTPDTVAVADVNSDGKLDLVVGNHGSGNISVFLGNGDGTFQAAANYSTPASGTPDSLVVTDFNGDGKPDIAVAISGINASSVALLLGNGDGTFQTAIIMPSGFHSPGILRIAAGDFNSDGKSDLAVTDGATLSILAGNGTGAIPTPAARSLIGPGAAINGSIVVADFNGDGYPDIAVTTRDGIFVLSGLGTDPFQTVVNYNPFLGGAIAIGDFNGDGRPDIVTADSAQDSIPTDTVAVLLNTTTAMPVSLTVNTSPTGLPFTVYYGLPNGNAPFTPCGGAPCTYNATWGTFFQIYAPVTVPGSLNGLQYALGSFSDGGPSVLESSGANLIHTVAFPGVASAVTVNYHTQEEVMTVANPAIGGGVAPASGYRDANSAFTLTATSSPGYTFQNWTASQIPGNPTVGGTCATASCAQHVSAPVIWTATFTFTGQRCDLNSDVQVTTVDVQTIISQALGLSPPSADLNRDGAVTISDAQVLLNVVRGAGTCPQ